MRVNYYSYLPCFMTQFMFPLMVRNASVPFIKSSPVLHVRMLPPLYSIVLQLSSYLGCSTLLLCVTFAPATFRSSCNSVQVTNGFCLTFLIISLRVRCDILCGSSFWEQLCYESINFPLALNQLWQMNLLRQVTDSHTALLSPFNLSSCPKSASLWGILNICVYEFDMNFVTFTERILHNKKTKILNHFPLLYIK